jgi:hypothetical protein
MSGFEVIVRPVVFPSIRPAPARSLAPEDDPEKGVTVLGGSGGKLLALPVSWTYSMSKNRVEEVRRRYAATKIYQRLAPGEINKENFVETERMEKIWQRGPDGDSVTTYEDPPEADNVVVKKARFTRWADPQPYIEGPGGEGPPDTGGEPGS